MSAQHLTSADRPSADRAGAGSAWVTVALREFRVRITDRNFLISTLTPIVIMLVGFGAQALMAARAVEHAVVVSSAQGQVIATQIGTALHAEDDKATMVVRRVADDAAARTGLQQGEAGLWLHEDRQGWTLTTKNDSPDATVLAVAESVIREDALARNAAAAGTTVPQLLAGTQLRADQLEGDSTELIVRMVTGFVLAFLFYLVSLLFGLAIAGSVVEEKQSRIVEIIASAIPLRQLLLGKVVGNTALALLQLAAFLAVGILGLRLTSAGDYLSAVTGPIGWFVAFFLVGFIALACLWAVAGALASRQEDLQATSTPLTMLIFLAFFGGIMAKGTLQTVLSFLPITSGVTMPLRLLQGNAATWEPVVSLLVSLAFAAAMILFGERVYRRSVMQTSGRISLRQALRTPE